MCTWQHHRIFCVFKSVRARWKRSEETNNSGRGEQSCLPSDSLMCLSAHGNNRLIKSEKKINNVEVAPGHRSREKLQLCVPLFFSLLQLFYFSDPPQAKAKRFELRWPEYHSNLNGCKWFHYQALKGSEQENEAGCGG